MFERRLEGHDLGRLGERRAAWFYRLRGFRIVERNLRTVAGEVDLIARRGRLLVVAEVKARSGGAMGEGHEAVDREKRERLIRIAEVFLARAGDPRITVRFDVLTLRWTGLRFIVKHYPDAFRPRADARRPWKLRG